MHGCSAAIVTAGEIAWAVAPSDGAVIGAHALLGPALPVQVAVPHALPTVLGGHRVPLEPGGGHLATCHLPPFGSFVSDGQDVVAAAARARQQGER